MKKLTFKYLLEFVVIVLGISVSFWFDKYQNRIEDAKKERVVLNQYILDGKLEEGPTQIVLSDSGFLFADAIAKDFFRVS